MVSIVRRSNIFLIWNFIILFSDFWPCILIFVLFFETMGSNGKANRPADPRKDPVIIIENKMAKVDPHDDQEVTKAQIEPSECESTDESCYLKCGKTLHSKPAQVRLQ